MNPMDRRLLSHANWGLLGCTLLLMLVGIVNLYSASSIRTEDGYYLQSYFERQVLWFGVGFVCMIICSSFDYKLYKTMAAPILLLSIALLALVPFIGITVKNAKRWISFGIFNLQPSEFAKISVLLMGAVLLARHKDRLNWRGLGEVVLICSVPCALILAQPDLGTTLNLLLLIASMILYQGVRASVFIPSCIALPVISFISWFYLHDYQRDRILTFIDPAKASAKSVYQVVQSKITIGSGQMWGNSFMEGTQSKLRFLPEKHTDFAVAVFCEEWGFVGSVALMTLFCLFLLYIIQTAREAKDRFGSLLCAGVFFYFFWQILINIGMVVGVMPVVGIPLPFISYGGTTTLVNFFMLSLVINVSMRRFMFKSH